MADPVGDGPEGMREWNRYINWNKDWAISSRISSCCALRCTTAPTPTSTASPRNSSRKHPDLPEGELTRIRAALVCEESLHEVAQSLRLGEFLLLGKGEESGGGRRRPSILADAVEAVLAAVYLDGGIDEARALIHRILLEKEQEQVVESRRRDCKTELQELVQRKPNQVLHYELVSESGPDHAKVFAVAVTLNGQVVGLGSGHSKKEAEQSAARAALEQMK